MSIEYQESFSVGYFIEGRVSNKIFPFWNGRVTLGTTVLSSSSHVRHMYHLLTEVQKSQSCCYSGTADLHHCSFRVFNVTLQLLNILRLYICPRSSVCILFYWKQTCMTS